jgi:phospholipid N-methyltransferase
MPKDFSFVELAEILLKVLCKGKRKAIVFDIPSIVEFQFIQDVLLSFVKQSVDDIIFVAHHNTTKDDIITLLPQLSNRVIHIPFRYLKGGLLPKIDIFITSEQFVQGVNGVYSVCLFHGPSAKGVSFTPEVINRFDAFFMIGPLHKLTFEEYLSHKNINKPNHLMIHEIGYPKSDNLINGKYNPSDVSNKLKLDPQKKTVIYAPAFNENASLRENGVEIVNTICSENEFNVIAKLPIDCLENTTNWYATGGIDWFLKLNEIGEKYKNFQLYDGLKIDEVLSVADVLITCVSSVGFEFMALNKPVIFIDSPKFYENIKQSFPFSDVKSWQKRSTVNGGREFGLVVKQIPELKKAIREVLNNPNKYPKNRKTLQKKLLYNRGKGVESTIKAINQMLTQGLKTQRPMQRGVILKAIIKILESKIKSIIKFNLEHLILQKGYRLTKTGLGYISAKDTIKAAQHENLSLCEYLEGKHNDPRRIGRRDRIISEMNDVGVFKTAKTVCEIGSGTGMYLEKVIKSTYLKQYEVYETDKAWSNYLKNNFGFNKYIKLIVHPSDGFTLKLTPSQSVDLVHVHAVFVYIPILQTFSYLKECIRVVKSTGYIVFDVITDSEFSYSLMQKWLNSMHRWPVVLSHSLLEEFFEQNRLNIVHEFSELYGPATCHYYILRKRNRT